MIKSFLTSILALTCIGSASVLADDGKFQAAVVIRETNAELRAPNSLRSTGRRIFEVGEVYEVRGKSGMLTELKLDDTEIAVLPPSALIIRSCTPAELAEAQAKFNVVSSEAQRKVRQEMSTAKREVVSAAGASAAKAACATCPKVREGANAALGEKAAKARKEYLEKTKALREKNQALASESLAWAKSGD